MMIYTTIVQNNSGGYSGSSSGVGDAIQIGFWILTIVMKVMTTGQPVILFMVTCMKTEYPT
jgi:hypothetical protein